MSGSIWTPGTRLRRKAISANDLSERTRAGPADWPTAIVLVGAERSVHDEQVGRTERMSLEGVSDMLSAERADRPVLLMNKAAAIDHLNRTRKAELRHANTHFANVNSSKAVWWLDLPIDEVFDETEPFINLVLAASSEQLYHLRVPKEWLTENIEQLAVREDKDVISLELSCMPGNLFQDVRPTSGRLNFSAFRV